MPPVAAAGAAILASAAAGSAAPIAGVSLGATVLGTAITVGQVIGVAITALSVIGQAVYQRSQSGPTAPAQSRLSTINQSRAPRLQSLGRVKSGGSFAWYGVSQVAGFENHLCQVLAMECQRIDGIEAHYLNNEEVTLDADGWVQTPEKWRDLVRITWNYGDDDQPALAAAVEAIAEWTPAHRGRGIAQVFVMQKPVSNEDRLATYPGDGRLQYTNVRRGAKVYDLRNPAHDPHDEATFEWSDNNALATLHRGLHRDGSNYDIDDIHLLSWSDWADHCDETIIRHDDTTEPRYRAASLLSLAGAPREILGGLLGNGDAVPYLSTGVGSDGELRPQLAVQFGAPSPSNEQVFTADHATRVTLRKGVGLLDGFNSVVAQITDPQAGYQDQSVPAVEDADAIAERGRRQVFALPLDHCPSTGQAQRLAKKKLRRLRPRWIGSVSTNLAGVLTSAAKACRTDIQEMPEIFDWWVQKHSFKRGGTSCSLEVESIAPDYDDWDKSEDQPVDYSASLSASGQVAPPLTGFSATVADIAINSENGAAQADFAWDALADPTITTEVQAREDVNPQRFFDWTTVLSVPAEYGAGSSGLLSDGSYEFRARHRAASGVYGEWVFIPSLAIRSGVVAAPVLSSSSSSVDTGENYTLTVDVPDDVRVAKAQLYRDGVEDGEPFFVARAEAFSVTRKHSSTGTFVWTAAILNVSGLMSPPSNAVSVTVSDPVI